MCECPYGQPHAASCKYEVKETNEMTTTLVAPRDGRKVTGMPTSGFWLAVGHPKSGKSTTFAKFPGAYVLMTEKGGGDHIDGKGLRIHEIVDLWGKNDKDEPVLVKTALDDFGDVLDLAISDDSVQTVIVDTIDQFALWVAQDILRSMGKNPNDTKPQEKNFSFWDELAKRINGFTDYVKDSGKLVIGIAHCKPPERDEKGQVVVPAGLNVQGKGAAYLASHADAICYIEKRIIGSRPQQFASFNAPSNMALWGSRIPELDGKEFLVPVADPYSAFAAMFVPAKPPAPTTLRPAGRSTKKR